ncbi:hypothetical protein DY000_02034265 [Brassica cretica]|uniref:Uncharacterized protein n=1 Tax=Brassica cretica TaxID=69181 RepID=A0ABQ7DF38_BRACR|nr:hypothetical protein DY000_02034265 [Brassica cretica]
MISSPDSGEQKEFINGWAVHHLPVQEFLISEEEERTEEVEEKERQSPTTSSDMASGDLALEEFFQRSQHCYETATEAAALSKKKRRWRSSSHHEKQSDGSHTTLPKPATNKDDTPQTCDEVSTPDPCLEEINESSVVDNVIHTDADDLVSLATISVLENM